MTRHAFHRLSREHPVYTGTGDLKNTLFDRAVEPRAKRNATPASQEAAERAKPRASAWATLALQLYASGARLTPDEAVLKACEGKPVEEHRAIERALKPRISNVLHKGFLETTDVQRKGDELQITEKGRQEAQRRGVDPLSRLMQAGRESAA